MRMYHEQERRGQRGMTLLEVVFAMAIFSAALLFTLSTLMSTITANRMMTANATANAAILRQREWVQQIAASDPKAPAAAIVRHFAGLATIGSASGTNGIAVGPNGTAVPKVAWDNEGGTTRGLVYTFALPLPAESLNDVAPSALGYGKMLIYLDETAVPVTVTWNDLGTGGGAPAGSGSGYDINGDGTIRNGLNGTARNALASGNFAAFDAQVQPLRLPVDISIQYFTNPAQGEPNRYYDTTRRSVFIGLNSLWNE